MKLILHIIRKDFRHLRFILSAWIALVVLMGASTAHWAQLSGDSENYFHLYHVLAQFAIVELLVRAAVVSRLIHSDSTVGSTAFWLSRPIPKAKLLASKAVFLALLVVLPTAILESELGSPFSRTPPQFLDALLSSMTWIAVFTMMAVLTRNLAGMAALAGSVLVAIWSVTESLFAISRWYREDGFVVWDLSGEWVMLFLVVTSGAVTCHQYLTRRTMRSRVLAFLGMPIVLLVLSGPWF